MDRSTIYSLTNIGVKGLCENLKDLVEAQQMTAMQAICLVANLQETDDNMLVDYIDNFITELQT